MYYQIQTDASDKRWWDYSALFKTRNARSRLICVMGMAFFGQWYVFLPHQQQWQSGGPGCVPIKLYLQSVSAGLATASPHITFPR
jgi:hypothetical protein